MKKLIIFILKKISRIIFYIIPDEFKKLSKGEKLLRKLEDNYIDEVFNHFLEHYKKSLLFKDPVKIREYAIQTSLMNDNNKQYYYLEFGVAAGHSTNFFSKFVNKLYCFDSFEGLKEDWGGTFGGQKGFYTQNKKIPKLYSNIEPVVGNNESDEQFYMIYINDNILFYELVNISGTEQQCTNRIARVCEYRCTDGTDNNVQFDTAYSQNLFNAYFKVIIINNYDDYNYHINSHNENSLKRFAYETDDINYPFYIIQPKNHPGKCLNFENGELGEFKVRVKPCSNTKSERFEAMIYESNFGCAPAPAPASSSTA